MFAVFITATVTERDFEGEFLFFRSSVVTKLVTSQEFEPIRCATTLYVFGRTRNGYVATRFIILGSTAESSTTSGYVVVQDASGKMRNPPVELRKGLGKNLVLLPAVDLSDVICKHM